MRDSLLSLLLCLLLCATIVSNLNASWATEQTLNLTSVETEITNRINGTNAYNYDLELESIGLNHSLSGYSFRSSGSIGANATVEWIQEQFESFGLDTHAEAFQFTTWNMMTKPVFKADLDGNPNTTEDQVVLDSFQPEHYSWPTPDEGIFAPIVILPMPEVSSHAGLQGARYDASAWLAVNTTGKILLVGKEIRSMGATTQAFRNKLQAEPPAALIYTIWYDWSSWTPPFLLSVGGRPAKEF
jgi:hypothetical protein